MINVILVAGSEEIRQFVRKSIEDLPVRIAQECATVKSAIEALSSGSIDLVIVDMFIPGTSGTEAIKTMRKMKEDMQFVLITRLNSRNAMDRAFRYGAQDVVNYPCTTEQLRDTLAHRISPSENERGFTLVEILLAVSLVAILSVAGVSLLTRSTDENRYDTTVDDLRQIRVALVGDPSATQGGVRSSFGYLGDIGGLPNAAQGLAALTTLPSGMPTFAVNAAARIGAGWNGPYYMPTNPAAGNSFRDKWGRSYVYTPGVPATVASYGADGVAGGSGLDQDISVSIPAELQTSTVHGFLSSGGAPYAQSFQVKINYPNGSGALTSRTITVPASAQGAFSLPGIPLGTRSISIFVPTEASPTRTLGPLTFVVDKPNFMLPPTTFDLNPLNTGTSGGTSTNTNTSTSTSTSTSPGGNPKVLYFNSSANWTIPADWNNSNNSIEVIGGGGGGKRDKNGGGGGGAYSKKTNVSLIPGLRLGIVVGSGGVGNQDGGDSYVCTNMLISELCPILVQAGLMYRVVAFAKGGRGNQSWCGGVCGNQGGDASAGIGDTKFSGGEGARGNNGNAGGGGGGAAGFRGAGLPASNTTGGAGNAGFGGAGGVFGNANGGGNARGGGDEDNGNDRGPNDASPGGNGREWTGSPSSYGAGGGGSGATNPGGTGGNYGGGGGGGGKNRDGGTGGGGLVRIMYVP